MKHFDSRIETGNPATGYDLRYNDTDNSGGYGKLTFLVEDDAGNELRLSRLGERQKRNDQHPVRASEFF